MEPKRSSSRRLRAVACAAGTAVVGALLAAAPAAAAVPEEGLLVSYDFAEASGAEVHDASASGNDGTLVGGEAWRGGFLELSGDNYVELPDDLLADRSAASIIVETTPEALSGAQFLWNIGGSGTDAQGQFFIQPVAPRLSISSDDWNGEQTADSEQKLQEGESQSIGATIERNDDDATSTLRLYVDGELSAEKTDSTTSLDDLNTHTMNYLGKSAYASDTLYQGRVTSMRVYDRALAAGELQSISEADASQAAADATRAIDLDAANEQDLAAIETDILLPTSGGVTWAAEPAGVIAADGAVTPQEAATDVVLTATATVRGETAQRAFDVTVAPAPADAEQAQRDLDAITIPNADDIRGDIALPAAGERYGSELSWSSDAPDIVDVDGGAEVAPGAVTRPEGGDVDVVLTATAHVGEATVTRELRLVVRKAYEQPRTTDYLFAHFTGGEGSHTDEQIYFATSHDAETFSDTRANGDPVLSIDEGQEDGGVRDPFLVRSPEGDRFFLIATDLSIHHRGGWGNAQATTTGSTKMTVWESTDLVNWSEPRFPDVAGPIGDAGMLWAPEAYWDDTTQQYYVFWATRSESQNALGDPVNMFIATTRDFVTFSEPTKWIDREGSIIDTTVFQVGDWFYRASGDGQITIEKSKSIATPSVSATAQTSGGEDEWVLVDTLQSIMNGTNESCGTGNNYTGGCLEGPEFFRYNDDDTRDDEVLYGLMADQYGAGLGYLPFRTTDIGSTDAADWTKVSDVDYGALKKRHGTILPITAAEYERVRFHYAGSGEPGSLADVSLVEPAALAFDPVVDTDAHTVMLPVVDGTDVSELAPTFLTAHDATASPASGTVVDLTSPVEYTVSSGGAEVVWTLTAEEVTTPVLDGYNADPNIAVFGDTYYIYATSDGYAGWGGTEFYVWKSKDLVDWTRSDEPFLTLDGENGDVPWATGNAWAPTIIERDGKYYFYFSGHNPDYNRKTIGVAVADSPEGPFAAEPEAMVLNNEEVASGQAIDPAAFRDPETGKYYLAWGNGGPSDGPVIAELGDDMVSLKEGTFQRIEGLTDFREGVFLNYRDGLYHLTYSIDDTGSENYRVGYATATSIDGPWTYRGVILEKDLSLGIKGTGHSSVLNVPGTDDWYIVYHRFAIPDGDGQHRETTIDKLEIGEDGLFQTVRPTLTGVSPQPVPAGGAAVDAEAVTRCIAGNAFLTVRVTNGGDEPADAVVATAYGERSIDQLAAGESRSVALNSRTASFDAGEVEVTATSGEASAATTAEYEAASCG